MSFRSSPWLHRLKTLGVTSLLVGVALFGCSDDDAGSPGAGAGEGGEPAAPSAGRTGGGSGGTAGTPAGGTAGSNGDTAGAESGGSESGGSGMQLGGNGGDSGEAGQAGAGGQGTEACGFTPDSDTRPKVRLFNARNHRGGPGTSVGVQLRVNGQPLAGLASVPEQTAESISKYAPLDLAAGTSVTFGIRADAEGTVPTVNATPITLAAGGRYTVVSMGGTLEFPEAPDGMTVVLKDDVSPVACDKARLRFFGAANVTFSSDPVNNAGYTPSLYLEGEAEPLAKGLPTDAAPAAGRELELGARRFRVALEDPLYLSPTGSYLFTLPASLAAGRSYYVMTYQSNWRTDGFGPRLVFLPMGDDAPATIVRVDPLVTFVNVAQQAKATSLDVYLGAARVARNLRSLGSLTDDELAGGISGVAFAFLPPDGVTLAVKGATEPAEAPKSAAIDTGKLERGQSYLSVVSGPATPGSEALQQVLTKVDYPLPSAPVASETEGQRVIFVNGAVGSPKLDFGSFVGPTLPTTFQPQASQIEYGKVSATNTSWMPLQFLEKVQIPEGAPGTFYEYARVGVQAGADASSNRSFAETNNLLAFAPSSPSLYVVIGEWGAAAPLQLFTLTLGGDFVYTARLGVLAPRP